MLVRYSEEKYALARQHYLRGDRDYLPLGEQRLEDGQHYIVMAVYLMSGLGEAETEFVLRHGESTTPLRFESVLFDVVNPRLSKWWIYHSEFDHESRKSQLQNRSWLAFPEWKWAFFEELVDGEASALRIFRDYEELMELEWPRPDVTEAANLLQDEWVMCPTCTESWQVVSRLALTKCPACEMMLNNPTWSDPAG